MTATLEEVANKAFDYIIIGGGTAGLTLAARLSEDESTSVLVLESGGANIAVPDILRPGAYGSHFANSSYAYSHKWIKQKFSNDKEGAWERGKGLGGSSAINFLCWLKPAASDIDDFEKLGNPGWNYANFTKFLDRTEGFVEPSEATKKRYGLKTDGWKVGRQGPLSVIYPAKIDEAELRVKETFHKAGIPEAPAPLSGNPNGYYFTPNTHNPDSFTRSYSVTAHYLPNKGRKNLTVLCNATVLRLLTKSNANGEVVATGVSFDWEGKTHETTTNKEVILSAGTLTTPLILEQSGIGRRDLLEKINIPVKLDLPGVGENLQEHTLMGISYELKEEVELDTIDYLRDPILAAKHLELHAKGAGLHAGGVVGFCFLTLDQLTERAPELYKAMQDLVAGLDPATTTPGLIEQYKILLERYGPNSTSPSLEFVSFPGFFSGPKPPVAGKRYITIFTMVNNPFSRGTIHSVSNNPLDPAEIDPHYFEQTIDLDLMAEVVKRTRQIATLAPFKDLVVEEYNPGPEVDTDEQIKDWIKNCINTVYHTAGACAMAPKDKNGVVDHNLKVYGTSNLRVVDLSVLPLHIGTHTQSTVYAIAEQAADIIKGKFSA